MGDAENDLEGEEEGNETEDEDQRSTTPQALRSAQSNPTPVPQIRGKLRSPQET